MQDLVSVIVDDREPQQVIDALRLLPGCQVAVRRLKTGDYQVDDRLLFERKTLPDFAASVIDGRLFRQAAKLSASRFRPLIILEGSVKDLAGSGISREALQGALISASVIFGIPLLRSLGAAETARLIFYTARQVGSMPNGAVARKGQRPKAKRKIQLHILQGLPGIGPARAQSLLARYGSIENVVQADYNELVDTPGIGQETARRIRWAVGEPSATYDLSDPDLIEPAARNQQADALPRNKIKRLIQFE